MAIKLITPPASYPVTLEEAKKHLREVVDDFDAEITAYIAAATGYTEAFTGRALIDQTWELTYDAFPTNELQIPLPPLIEVVSVSYDDTAGDAQTLNSGSYFVDNQSEPGWIVPADETWPETFDGINAVRIRFRAGYLNSDSPPVANVPADIKQALLLYVGTFFAHRETIVIGQTAMELPWASKELLRMHRIPLGMA